MVFKPDNIFTYMEGIRQKTAKIINIYDFIYYFLACRNTIKFLQVFFVFIYKRYIGIAAKEKSPAS